MTYSRRSFLQQASAMAALGLTPLVDRGLWRLPAEELLADPSESMLKELALAAMDEARRAGATFADIRINAARMMQAQLTNHVGQAESSRQDPWVGFGGAYGIRTIVDGAWGFASTAGLTKDAVINGVRLAVQGARTNRPRRQRTLELAPRPVVENGRWATAIDRDPFSVPIVEQLEALQAAFEPVRATKNPAVQTADLGFTWRKCLTIYASTDGSLIVQPLFCAMPGGTVTALGKPNDWLTRADMPIKGFQVGPYGYESLGLATLQDRVRTAIDEAVELARRAANAETAEVGRYDLIFAPHVTAALMAATVGEALRISRVLGYEANEDGTSFAGPPKEMLGTYKIGAPSLTLRGDRSQTKGAATVGWDEEGVKPEGYTFVKDGVITDYHADRQMALELGDWYTSQGSTVRSHGLARRTGEYRPVAMIPNVTMEPAKTSTTSDDLIRATKRGYYIEGFFGNSDQQVLNSQFVTHRTMVRRIINGKFGPHVKDFSFQFITPSFWKAIDGLGGASSAESHPTVTDRFAAAAFFQPFPYSTIRAVPIRVRDANVLNTGRTA